MHKWFRLATFVSTVKGNEALTENLIKMENFQFNMIRMAKGQPLTCFVNHNQSKNKNSWAGLEFFLGIDDGKLLFDSEEEAKIFEKEANNCTSKEQLRQLVLSKELYYA